MKFSVKFSAEWKGWFNLAAYVVAVVAMLAVFLSAVVVIAAAVTWMVDWLFAC